MEIHELTAKHFIKNLAPTLLRRMIEKELMLKVRFNMILRKLEQR